MMYKPHLQTEAVIGLAEFEQLCFKKVQWRG